MRVPHYELIAKGKRGRLLDTYAYHTPVKGYEAEIMERTIRTRLSADGTLTVFYCTEWDFGSGPAVDTPAMVTASLAHDIFCHLTDRGLIPWECRAPADGYFRQVLKDCGNGAWRHARWLGVRFYSTCLAKWRRKK